MKRHVVIAGFLALIPLCPWALAEAQPAPPAPAPTPVPTTAPATEDDAGRAASARALFQQGVKLADAGQWTEAAQHFQSALALRDSPVIAYNLASALGQLGQLLNASQLLRRVSTDPLADPELRASASASLANIEPRLGRLHLQLQGDQPGDRIAIDDRVLPQTQLGVAFPIDPGTHVVSVQRGEQVLQSEPIVVFEGVTRELSLRLVPTPAPRDAAKSMVAADASAATSQSLAKPQRAETESGTAWWLWAGAGALAAGAITVAAVVLASGSSGNDPVHGDFDPPVLRIGAR
jgi:tetratricopeptide (TPR) repeat protein